MGISIGKIIATVLCVFIAATASCTANSNYQIRRLVETGKTDAISASCAISTFTDRVICTVAISKNKPQE